MYKYFCGGLVTMLLAFNVIAMDDTEVTILADEHKEAIRTMLVAAYKTKKPPYWPDLQEDTIQIVPLDENSIRATGTIDLSTCLTNKIAHVSVEAKVNNSALESPKYSEMPGSTTPKQWLLYPCIIAGTIATTRILQSAFDLIRG